MQIFVVNDIQKIFFSKFYTKLFPIVSYFERNVNTVDEDAMNYFLFIYYHSARVITIRKKDEDYQVLERTYRCEKKRNEEKSQGGF